MDTIEVKGNEDLGALSPLRLEYSDQIFTKLAEVLNEVHQMNHSTRFWKLITEEYVRAVINRIQELKATDVKAAPGLYPIVVNSLPDRRQKIRRGTKQLLNYLKTRKNRGLIYQLIRENDLLLSGFKDIPGFKEETGGVELPDQELIIAGAGNRKIRKRLDELAEQADEPIIKNVIRQIPKIYVEHFRPLYDSVELFDPGSKTFHVMGNFHLGRRQLTIARYIEEGARLIWHQNGAFIGEVVYKNSRYLSHGVADEYRTWGWQLTEKDQPGKAWFLEKFRAPYEEKSQESKEYDLLLCFPKLRPQVRDELLESGAQILRNLDRHRYPRILVRPQLSGSLTGQIEALQAMIADTRAELSTGRSPMAAETASAQCVVQMSVPATNFMECIYMNHPTIGILNNKQPTDLIQPWYRFLEKRGVLHPNAELLAEHLNRIEIVDWWSQLISSDGYQEFKNKFAKKNLVKKGLLL